ncbi:MAG TPA: histidinol-phosphate transaminase [Gaiellaceae bacterium]|nr:histidinol-phosphate transaminase [Gaiellaceae bacterium]
MTPLAEIADSFFKPAVRDLVPYEPGKPVEEVQRELGLDHVVKLASNEGPFPPFQAALEAMERAARDLNRYPDGGAFRLRAALAERHGVGFEEIAVGAGADGVIDCVSQAFLDSGDEVVCGWPSFPSYVIDALKLGATPVRVPLADGRYDLDGLLAAITPRTKVVYVCHPNNPTGTMNTRAELDAYFDRVPEHVLTVLDQAYLEYIDDPEYADGIDEYFRQGHRVLVVRTFSKIYGLAGLRIGWGVGSGSVVSAIAKVRRAFDLNAQAQVAAVASLGDDGEVERRRRMNAEERPRVVEILERHGFACTPAVANFVHAESGEEDARPLFEALLREGVIVRPLAGFGAPSAFRVTVGSPEDNAALDGALGRVRAASKV